eukprot:Nitzschia sp. Nitz4//scaffold334_size18717//4148//5962//NITZ4_008760-RA/size18717-processed-gene-0.10-mRNA-1//1//CDS//3329548245//2018//frame0
MSRCSLEELRRAAGSSSLQRLQTAVESGWTASDMDTAETNVNGTSCITKTPLHMACWKGALSNVQYLMETVGCDLQVYSTARHSYGKTAIFFALTQSRVDVVQYLLTIPNLNVSIVNNKGQSVLSIAASHQMPDSVMERIQALEQPQHAHWWNFRKSHSDGLVYGDLDPRFLERPLLPTDVVTRYAVNPTSAQTRKGNFARHNPHVVAAAAAAATTDSSTSKVTPRRSKTKKKDTQHKKPPSPEQLEQAWTTLEQQLDSIPSLLNLISLCNQQRRPWVQETYQRLLSLHQGSTTDLRDRLEQAEQASSSSLQSALVVKLLERGESPSESKEHAEPEVGTPEKSRANEHPWDKTREVFQSPIVQHACQAFSSFPLDWTALYTPPLQTPTTQLRLPHSPNWVDSVPQIEVIRVALAKESIVAMDTEWTAREDGTTVIALIQLAVLSSNYSSGVEVWIVDALTPDPVFQQQAKEWVQQWMETPVVLVGFAMNQDLVFLQNWCDPQGLAPLPRCTLLDVQWLMVHEDASKTGSLPSLKSCVERYSNIPLSKEQQCSEWGTRPLSKEQVDYAALDAAVLFYLLASYLDSCLGCKPTTMKFVSNNYLDMR